MNVLRTVTSSCKAIKRARKNSKVKAKPVRMIVHVGAGVGKSMTIRAVSNHAENILREPGGDTTKPRVLLHVFAAKAFNLINNIIFIVLLV